MALKGDAGEVATDVALDDDRARVHELRPQLVQLRHLARPQEYLRGRMMVFIFVFITIYF